MANDEHLAKIEQGVSVWNSWRRENPNIQPDLSGASLEGDLSKANFRRTDLTQADLSNTNLTGATFTGADASKANLRGCNLNGGNLNEGDFSGANISSASLSGADLSRANFSEADLSNSDLRRVDISRADIHRTNLSGASLSGANISGSELSYADLTGTSLRRANLRGADLRKANLKHADLQRANLTKANLNTANLFRANLSKANLTEADLSDANLSKAHLTETKFEDADCRGVDWGVKRWNQSAAYLSGCVTTGTKFSFRTAEPWHILKRSYSDAMFLIILLGSVGAFFPYVAEALFYKFTSGTDDGGVWILWHVLGFNRENWPWHVTASILLISYNGIRAFVTWKVVALGHEEAESRITPDRKAYRPLFLAHFYFLRWVLALSLLSMLFKLVDLLTTRVRIPL